MIPLSKVCNLKSPLSIIPFVVNQAKPGQGEIHAHAWILAFCGILVNALLLYLVKKAH